MYIYIYIIYTDICKYPNTPDVYIHRNVGIALRMLFG